MQTEIKDGYLAIMLPMEKDLPLSRSGKTRIVASTRGNVKTSATFNGQPVTVTLTAYIRNDTE